ncbi:monocarboxylate transporter 9-like isoform X1 [Dermacentor silvarum]|uniref:monocarboxylate transporter 9-like isoform X1 n=1 Tax=Dermacentor silvarum TaxID=543639 RepID=UPI0021007DDD|nr:monocarboxylate transporter 9-like isoform X1 [Dermacentor silvarum]
MRTSMKACVGEVCANVPRPKAAQDGCWHVAAVACLLTCLASALTRSSGFLYVGIMEQYGADHAEASWPIALASVLNNMAGLVAGPICQKIGAVPVLHAGCVIMWVSLIASSFSPNIMSLSFTMGALFGIGSGTTFITLHVLVNQHFKKYKGLALGIMYTGCTASAFIFPRLLLFLANTYGFRGSMLIFGGITMHATALALLLKNPDWTRHNSEHEQPTDAEKKAGVFTLGSKDSNHSQTPSEEATTDKTGPNPASLIYGITVLRSPMLYVILFTYIVLYFNFGVFMTTVVDFAVDRGSSVASAVNLVPLFSITDTVGRLGLPVLADRGYIRRSTLTMLNYSLMAVCMFALPFSSSYAALLAVCMFVALFQGCGIPLYPALMAEYIGLERLPIGYGIVGTVAGPLFLLNPLFIGYFRDKAGCYDNMYKVQALTLILLGVTWMIVVCAERKRKRTWSRSCNEGENAHIITGPSSCHWSGKYHSFSCSKT